MLTAVATDKLVVPDVVAAVDEQHEEFAVNGAANAGADAWEITFGFPSEVIPDTGDGAVGERGGSVGDAILMVTSV